MIYHSLICIQSTSYYSSFALASSLQTEVQWMYSSSSMMPLQVQQPFTSIPNSVPYFLYLLPGFPLIPKKKSLV
jgi:hypothetical protein